MKTEKQNNPGLTKLCQLIQHMTVSILTTIDDGGVLVSRPMLPLYLDGNCALWFFTDLRSEKIKHLDAINLNFVDSSRATYVTFSGHGELNTQRSYINRLWTPFAKPWFPDGPESTNIALLKFVPDMAEYWDSSSLKMERIVLITDSAANIHPIERDASGAITGLYTQSRKSASG